MKWKYILTTNTIWASFDGGEVEADTREEALRLAEEELTANLNLVNEVLAINPSTANATISMGMDQIEVSPIPIQTVAKLVYFNFVTRVLVPENASAEVIVEAARENMIKKVNNNLHESLEEILDDVECPVQLDEILP
tara:strand:- start:8166 stop:8579 length:414 start_codon:yes stop_codon:yes gene_type:complete